MDARSLAELLEVSHAVGGRPDLVQGGGGNTSVKAADGKTLAVKASGTALADMTESAGWVEMDLEKLLGIFGLSGLDELPAAERETRVLEHQQSCVVGGPGERPSVEAALHALLGRVVIHTHPPAVNALTCGPGEAAMRELARPDEPPPLWVPYADPGYTLAAAVRRAVADYKQRHSSAPQVLFLENHGLFVSAEDAAGCIALHDDWVRRCDEAFERTAPGLQPCPSPDSAGLRAAMAALRNAWRKSGRSPLLARLSFEPELANAAASDEVAGVLADGALTPDQIVYTGSRSIRADSIDAAIDRLLSAQGQPAPPRVALVKGLGAVIVADDPARLDAAEATAAAAAAVARLAAGRGGARNLRPESADFIIHWEAEHYRARALEAEAATLAGKVAVVTGAASGLGLGIALGLVRAGAAVAFCDIDEAGLAQAVESAGVPARTLPVLMDVTDEDRVLHGFDRVVRHWGGVDITVCAAGVAPAFELVDLPLDQWRRALEINLTGYFLVGREAARVMKAQGGGGAMVLVSSKSGLEASKANSAYNATKAGELHLMRGWALELGPDGIRVNAVAPGNVFEGSKIWNPEYIRVCAKKKGIRPEEVIPYYVSLTALRREIKREDVADAVCFLCSDQARCITGQTLVIDSGQVMVR